MMMMTMMIIIIIIIIVDIKSVSPVSCESYFLLFQIIVLCHTIFNKGKLINMCLRTVTVYMSWFLTAEEIPHKTPHLQYRP